MLSDEEKRKLIEQYSFGRDINAFALVAEVERAVLAKAMPAHKQEPVHWRAVISDSEREHHTDASRHIVGFTRLSAAEEWVSAQRDLADWNYTIEPLYLYPAPP